MGGVGSGRRPGNMPGPDLTQRLALFADLRDAGRNLCDIERELGLSYETIRRYDRWYRSERRLPQREPGYLGHHLPEADAHALEAATARPGDGKRRPVREPDA